MGERGWAPSAYHHRRCVGSLICRAFSRHAFRSEEREVGQGSMVKIQVPGELSFDDRRDFMRCVLESGEVNPGTLPQLLDRAHSVAISKDGEIVHGVAGLKSPNVGYRNQAFEKAGVPELAEHFILELGWVFVRPHARQRGICRDMVRLLLERAEGCAVYATSAESNSSMHRVLKLFDFVPAGRTYASQRKARTIQLFLRSPEGRDSGATPLRGEPSS